MLYLFTKREIVFELIVKYLTLNFFQRRSKLKGANYLDLTPIRAASALIKSSQRVVLLMPKFRSNFARNYILPKIRFPYVFLRLDRIGSAFWMLIDGKNTVNALVDQLAQSVGESREEVESRLVKFLTLLYDEKLITFQEIKKYNAK